MIRKEFRWPLVSVVIPAYRPDSIERALDSIKKQSYENIELIISDDDRTGEISRIVSNLSVGFPIRYLLNENQLGEVLNHVEGVKHATGKYVKFLHDDDRLHPDCISELVSLMELHPDVSLASSRRAVVDGEGNILPENIATVFPFKGTVKIPGHELLNFIADYTYNFIGEPSCVLCRASDLKALGDQLMRLDGQKVPWLADLAMYANILRLGNFIFSDKTLSYIGWSADQASQGVRGDVGTGKVSSEFFRTCIKKLGWRNDQDSRMVSRASISKYGTGPYVSADLWGELHQALETRTISVDEWLSTRLFDPGALREIKKRLPDLKTNNLVEFVCVSDSASESEYVIKDFSKAIGALELSFPSISWSDSFLFTIVGAESYQDKIREAKGRWVFLLRPEDRFVAAGLVVALLKLSEVEDSWAVSCDAVYCDDKDHPVGPAFRPSFNLDYLLSIPSVMARHWFIRRESIIALSSDFAASIEHEFLNFHVILSGLNKEGLSGFDHLSECVLLSRTPELADKEVERLLILDHLSKRGYPHAEVGFESGGYRIRYHHNYEPLVSIIIPTRDQLFFLKRCVESLLEKTSYQNYEVIIVDNNSEDPDAMTWLDALEQMNDPKVRILRNPGAFNFSSMNNLAAHHAQGEYLLLLNNDVAIIDPGWLEAMLNHALRPEVGIVGAKLLYPDGRIQHAGVVLGLNGPADHAFIGEAIDSSGYMHRLKVDQDYSAVTAACLIIRKEIYEQVGGMDEVIFKVSYNDVDLCLKVGRLGYLVVWTPHAVLMHEGSVSQNQLDPHKHEAKLKRFVGEQEAMYERWLPALARDPAYSPNFSLVDQGGFKLANSLLSWQPLKGWKPIAKVLGHNLDIHGCGNYRMIKPFLAMKEEGMIDGMLSMDFLSIPDLERYGPDIILMQTQIGEERLEGMRRIKAFSNAFKVYEQDDYLPNLPLKSVHRQHMPKDILKVLRRGFGYVDRLVVSTQALADAYSGFHKDIRVVENRLPRDWWCGLKSQRRTSKKPRVGWAGGTSHTGDLELIVDVIKELSSEVDWVFFGMCPEKIRPHIHEYHDGVFIEEYSAKLAALNLDLAIAPLENNLFNECKSNLRLLEYGACGFPVVCSDLRCYQENGLPVTLVKNKFRDWVDAIRAHINDLDASEKAGDALREAVLSNWMLDESSLKMWQRAWTAG